jgi:hypothetical protein
MRHTQTLSGDTKIWPKVLEKAKLASESNSVLAFNTGDLSQKRRYFG